MITTAEARQNYLTKHPDKVMIDTIELKYPNNLGVWRLCLNSEKINKKLDDDSLAEFTPYNFKVGFPNEDEHINYSFPVTLDASDAGIYEEYENYLSQTNVAIDYTYRAYFEDSDEIQVSTSTIPYKLYNPTMDFKNNSLSLKGGLPDFINQTLSSKKYNKVDFPSLEYVYA